MWIPTGECLLLNRWVENGKVPVSVSLLLVFGREHRCSSAEACLTVSGVSLLPSQDKSRCAAALHCWIHFFYYMLLFSVVQLFTNSGTGYKSLFCSSKLTCVAQLLTARGMWDLYSCLQGRMWVCVYWHNHSPASGKLSEGTQVSTSVWECRYCFLSRG